MDTQLYLTIILLVVEVVAFGWLILDNVKSKKRQDEIIKLEEQILSLEETIMKSENIILEDIKDLKRMIGKKS